MARIKSRFLSRLSASAAALAAFSMAAAPAVAAPMPLPHTAAPAGAHGWSPADEVAHHGRYHHGGYRHDDGIDTGDVVAGLLIIGGIAAIASAASNSKKNREAEDYRYREPYPDRGYDYPDRPYPQQDYRNRDYDYSQPRGDSYRGSYSGGGIDNAVDICANQVERGQDRVASVDNATRAADGWRISGQLDRGGDFSCWIDNDGRIRDVDVNGRSSGAYSDDGYRGGYQDSRDNQWNDDAYARARAATGSPSPHVYEPADGGLGG